MSATLRASAVVSRVDETPVEAHLRRVLDTQPVPLCRVSVDGIFLAVNDAALSMLGAERLEQVLETSLLDMVEPGSRESCRVFLSRVAAGDRGSTEVKFTGLGGLAHTLQLHATAHPVSPDGTSSVLVTLRDVTEYLGLEHAVVEAAAREEQRAAAHAAEVARLSTQIADSHANATARSGDEARAAALEQQLAEAERKHQEAAERHAVLQAQARAEVQAAQGQLEATIAEHLSRLTEVEAALRTAEARERQMAAQHEADGGALRLALQQAQDDSARQVDELRQAVVTLETTLAAARTGEQDLAAAHACTEAEWRRSLDETIATHESKTSELQAAIDGLEQSLAEARAREQDRAAAHARTEAEWQRSLADAIATHESKTSGLQAAIASLEQSLAAAQAREQQIASTHQTSQSEWQRQAEQAAAAHQQQVGELRAAITGLETSVGALTQKFETAVADRNAVLNEHKEALHNLDALTRERDAALAANEEEKRSLAAERERARAEWEREHQQARAQWDRERQQLQAKWAVERAEVLATWKQDVLTKHRAELRARIASVETERDALNSQLVMVGHELAWSARLDHAERLGRAGRLSLSFADDIGTALERVADYGRLLMGDAGQGLHRESLAQMLAAATAAQALVRQLRHGVRAVEADPLEITPVIRSLERTLAALLSPDITLRIQAGAEGARVGLTSQQVEQVALTLAVNRRAAMIKGGQVTIELAEVDIDEARARERMASPGPYVLLAVHAAGPAVEHGIAPQLFGIPANEDTWQTAGPGMSGLFAMVNEWGGCLWASQEGPGALAFEIYLPRVMGGRDATPGGARR